MSAAPRSSLRPRRETSAGGVVFRREGDRLLVLLIRDVHGNWGFPKGHVERGETPPAAAIREVGEEAGITTLRIVAPAGTVEWTFRSRGTPVRKTCHYFAMSTRQVKTRPLREEGITRCRWAAPGEARRLLRFDNARRVLATAVRAMAAQGTAIPA